MADDTRELNDPTRRVLVVDDDNDALRILSDFLEARGFAAVPAQDGHEAIARFHDDGPFDIVILDVMMPGLDGLEVCRRLKASPHGQITPVLLLSARSDTRSRIAGLYGGADDYMSKPVDLRELLARIDVLLRVRGRYRELAERRGDDLDAAMSDGLTGAVNTAYFTRRLSEEIDRADRYNLPLTVIVADLIGLPEPEGTDSLEDVAEERFAGPVDRLLQATGEALRGNLRRHDLLARFRRARFAILLPHTGRHVVQPTIDRLRSAAGEVLLNPDENEGPKAGLSLHVGVAELGPKMDAQTLLAMAEPRSST